MNLQESIFLIKSFYPKELLLGKSEDTVKLGILEQEKFCSFPLELKAYIREVCPQNTVLFHGVGNPVELLSRNELSWEMAGYNFNPETKEPLSNWDDSWFLIAREGGEPIIVKLDESNSLSTVYSAMSGEGGWEFFPIADSIGQFLLCAAALEHAMNFPGMDDSLDDDFNLVGDAAKWLFPFLRKHAESYYDEWASVFENFDQ